MQVSACYDWDTVQLISKLTLACTEHVCVLQFLSSHTRVKCVWHATGCTRVIFCALHTCNILRTAHERYLCAYDSNETARESDFMCCTQVTLLVCYTRVNVELIPWSTYVRTLYLLHTGYKLRNGLKHGHAEKPFCQKYT